MRISEKWIVAAVAAVLIAAFSNFFYRTTALKHLDSVFLFESTQSILTEGRPVSRTVSAWPEALPTFSMPAETLCQSDFEHHGTVSYDVLDNHAYTILYLIAPLTGLLGPELAFALLNASAHILLILLPFLFLRKSGIRPSASLVFCLCIVLYPAWTYSATGDYYADRLYMPFALLALYAMYSLTQETAENQKKKTLLTAYAASTAIAALFTERAAIMMAGQILFFLLFFPKTRNTSDIRNTLAILLALIAAYLFVYFRFFHQGIEGGGDLFTGTLSTLQAPLQRLKTPGVAVFFIVNLLFMGVFISFSGHRLILLALGAILPNILIPIGGAELNGWSTHYHVMYIPFLIFTASVGYAQWRASLQDEKSRRNASLSACGYIIAVAVLVNPYSGKPLDRQYSDSYKATILRQAFNYYFRPDSSDERKKAMAYDSIASAIPPHTKVSTVEDMMPSLYRSRSLSYFPLDLYDSDYAVVSGATEEEKINVIVGAISYRGQEQTSELNQCLLQHMAEKGFFLFREEPVAKILVFKRASRS